MYRFVSQLAQCKMSRTTTKREFGVAFGGGGIRPAAFCSGVLRRLISKINNPMLWAVYLVQDTLAVPTSSGNTIKNKSVSKRVLWSNEKKHRSLLQLVEGIFYWDAFVLILLVLFINLPVPIIILLAFSFPFAFVVKFFYESAFIRVSSVSKSFAFCHITNIKCLY